MKYLLCTIVATLGLAVLATGQRPPVEAVANANIRNVCAGVPFGGMINVRDATDCQAYTMCLGPNAHPMRCAPNMHFSETLGDCDKEERANCVIAPKPEPEPIVPEPVDPNNPCSAQIPFEIIASGASCSEYTICACGTPHVRRCADGLVFDARTQQCNVPARATCVSAAAARPTCPRQPGNIGHPNDCKHFFMCLGQGEQPILRRCQARLNYNRRVNQCDFVDCVVPATGARMRFEEALEGQQAVIGQVMAEKKRVAEVEVEEEEQMRAEVMDVAAEEIELM